MKKNSILSFLMPFLLIQCSISQSDICNCKTEIEFLHKKIKKTPSYKANKAQYKEAYEASLKKAELLSSDYQCFVLLNKLLISLNDNHSKIYGIDKGATAAIKTNDKDLETFRKSKLYNTYPVVSIDIDSLQTALSKKSPDDIEGVYSIESMTIGVYRHSTSADYQAVIMSTDSDIWRRGELIYTLIPFGKRDYLLSIGGSTNSKRLIAYTERIKDGTFLTMGFQKQETSINHSRAPYPDTTYFREELSEDITYLKIGSFSGMYPKLSDAEDFYASLKGNLNKEHLIIDLRDNGGGGNRNSDILLKIIKDYLKDNNVYILTNHRTISNAEMFAYKLKDNKNAVLFGHRTNGCAAYEVKNSNYNLPCGNFLTVLTSKKHSKFLDLESVGLDPDWILNMDTDWVEQVVSYIENQ